MSRGQSRRALDRIASLGNRSTMTPVRARLLPLVFAISAGSTFLLPAPVAAYLQIPEDILNADNAPRENIYRVDGSVMSDDGPATNVEVLVEITDMRVRRQVDKLRTRTDENGEFSFDLRKFEAPELGLQFNTVSPRFVETMKILRIRWEELPGRMDLVVTRGAVATGKIFDVLGNPISGAKIGAPGIRTATSGKEGEFEVFGLTPGQPNQLRVTADGFADGFLNVMPNEADLTENLRLDLVPAAKFKGTVRDPLGRPVRGPIYFRNAEAGIRADVNKEGAFEFASIPALSEGAILDFTSGEWLPLRHALTAEELAARNVDLVVRPGVFLTGTLRGPDGAPVSNGELLAVDKASKSARPIRGYADAEGTWTIGPLLPGMELDLYTFGPSAQGRRAMGELELRAEKTPDTFEGDVTPWPDGYSSTFTATVQGDSVTMTRRDTGPGGHPGDVTYTGKLDATTMVVEGTISIPATGAKGTFRARKYNKQVPGLAGQWDIREEVTPGQVNLGPKVTSVTTGILPGNRLVHATLSAGTALRGKAMLDETTSMTQGTVMVVGWRGTRYLERVVELAVGGEFMIEGLPEDPIQIILMTPEGDRMSATTWTRGGAEDFIIYIDPPAEPAMDEIE